MPTLHSFIAALSVCAAISLGAALIVHLLKPKEPDENPFSGRHPFEE